MLREKNFRFVFAVFSCSDYEYNKFLFVLLYFQIRQAVKTYEHMLIIIFFYFIIFITVLEFSSCVIIGSLWSRYVLSSPVFFGLL